MSQWNSYRIHYNNHVLLFFKTLNWIILWKSLGLLSLAFCFANIHKICHIYTITRRNVFSDFNLQNYLPALLNFFSLFLSWVIFTVCYYFLGDNDTCLIFLQLTLFCFFWFVIIFSGVSKNFLQQKIPEFSEWTRNVFIHVIVIKL